ncbi:hypothetical protein PHET_00749 [Paragonimus heterotremus]|uniref:Uncharacterized protein n=1 Tax=Paragonimus heterotremus TaxID=100268 RepID=A0A8J4WLU0_9TREM|nr:hypothetical protein PHET_00749 [Paragonimus heterotremus]
MCENRDIKSWNTNFMSLSSAEKLQSQYAELSTVAKELALAAIRGRKGGEILNAVRDCRNTADYTTLESDPTYQAWFRYFMQLQLQDTQIKNWLVGRAPSVDHTPHLPTGRQSSVTTDLMKSPPVGGYAQPQDANSRTFPHNSVATNVQRTSEASPIFPIQVDGMPPAFEQPHSRTALEVQTEKLTHVNSPQFFSGPTQSPVDVNQLIQLLQSPMIARNNLLISCINEVLQTQQQLRQQQQHSVDPSLTMGCSAAEVQYVQRPAITRSLLSVPNVSIALVSDTNPTPIYAHATIPSVTEASKVMSTTPQITSQYIDEKEVLQNLFHQASRNVETNGTGLSNQTEKNREAGNYRMSAKEEIPNRPLSNIDPRVHETYSQQTMPRPRLRTHNRDRFLVRVLRITYQCACRPNPLVDQSKVAESRKMGCPSSECKTKKPRTYVTFQAQLPSITSSFRTSLSGNLIAPATGLRLGFTCALDSEGPSLQDFANQKVAERLDAWEQAGNLPGFRCQVLSALHDTVGLMLQRIREDGFTAVTLDSDYLFYPPSSELR